jgi:hypothetical protein
MITSTLPIIQNYLPEAVDSGRIIFLALMISGHPERHNGVRSGSSVVETVMAGLDPAIREILGGSPV